MEQVDISQVHSCEDEGKSKNVDVQKTQITIQDMKVNAVEEEKDLSNVCKLGAEESAFAVDNDCIKIEVTSKCDVLAEKLDGDNQVVSKPEVERCTPGRDETEVCEQIKDDIVQSNYESQNLTAEEDQSPSVITKSKVVEINEANVLESNCNIIEDMDQSNAVEKQNLLEESRFIKHSGGQIDDSVGEEVKEIHNDSNQNSSVVTDAELTKLVQEETEMVVVLETIPDSTDTTTDNYIVTLDEKDKEYAEDTVVTVQERKITKTDVDEIEVIDCSQESCDTIIEVTVSEQCEQDNKDCAGNKCDTEVVEIKEIVLETNITNENLKAKALDSKTLISSDSKKDDDIDVITEEEIINKKNINLIHKTDSLQVEDTVKQSSEHNKESTTSHKTSNSSAEKRSVIQDIFDDWRDENADDETPLPSKIQDSLELQLENLLDDTKTNNSVTTPQKKISSTDREHAADEAHNVTNPTETSAMTDKTENQKNNKVIDDDARRSLNKNEKNSLAAATKSSLNVTMPKNRSRHLTSQIASPAEVTEVLKERLREKQKNVDTERKPDIFFVKKLAQRLSSKLAGTQLCAVSTKLTENQVCAVPGLIPLTSSISPSSASVQADNSENKKTAENMTVESKDGNSDNKELLAILEGDVDPDWSNLKPPTLTEESKTVSTEECSDPLGPPKLDPLVERELALKQLLELPVTPSKKNSSKKKKIFQPSPNKESRDTATKSPVAIQEQKKVADVSVTNENTQANTKSEIDLCSPTEEKIERNRETEQTGRVEESRSGRKRKPTEKAREHEQNTIIKRQKVYRGKLSMNKKQENNATSDNSLTENHIATSEKKVDVVNDDTSTVTNNKLEHEVDSILKMRRAKQNLSRKGSITKRKMVVKKLLRQKISTTKKPVQLKTKLVQSSKHSPKTVPKSQKRTTEGEAKPKKKSINEIDRLLQDEGVVNLLYDVEQPDKKRLIPITKSRAKVMDLQKVQRELKIRKKLVRNAVLRLRTSTIAGVTKASPRSKRTAVHLDATQADKKLQAEQMASPKTPNAIVSPMEYIPAKIRNAADASVIVRRHSSSSFSSASGSPRVSIDTPDKLTEAGKSDDRAIHALRSAKKRQDEKTIIKRSKKRKSDTDIVTSNSIVATSSSNVSANNTEEKVVARPKKSEIKKVEKIGKQAVSTLEDNVSSKVTTRSSNGGMMGKVSGKNKRVIKNKAIAKTDDINNVEDPSKEETELAVCLAEAVSALSVVSSNGRSGNVATMKKNKVTANIVKTTNSDFNKTKETQSQFSNKEIHVRRHGNLVQLILTPSSLTKVRNALTLQVMQEFREALSILKRDDECRVVLLTSTGTSFCEGLDLSTLLHANKEERRSVAQKLAHAVKEFIKSLATFNKPIVAGVQGAAIGLGVTMLPLFDLVIASDKATFCTPYGKLGQIAEGAAIFTLSHILGSAITSELLLAGRTLTANEALRAGLVTRVLWPDRFQEDLLPSLRAMSDQSSQSMEATKALLRHTLRKKLDAALESETYLLIQHWCSAECQAAIKAYIDGKTQ
ncbi:claspin-like [Pseudomyrmex gracilis]|uniref:claspin-like n=1 Tax=Pseudomyrmex gracilis TaxID=219809 RepID=UPI000995974E|nr:claspin-like [Pseudomyrmex gracilis]XP_020298092.1 claspin-like [Pseudomyrmex gracilis]